MAICCSIRNSFVRRGGLAWAAMARRCPAESLR